MADPGVRVGFVGVGRMGANMARRLKDRGWNVAAVMDADPAAAESLASELGAARCGRPSAVAAAADVVITVVSDDAAMRAIYSGPGSLVEGPAGRLFINCATVTPSVHEEVERLAEAAGSASLEACMASSITQAREGALYLMCAGREAPFRRAEPVLRDLAASVRFLGPAGTAARVKALVNMVMNANTAALAEGLGLGAALGLDLDMLRAVFAQTGAHSRVLETDGADMQHRDHACFFSAEHAAKDSGIALQLAEEAGLSLPLAKATREQFDRMVREGLGTLDKSGVAELTFRGRHCGLLA